MTRKPGDPQNKDKKKMSTPTVKKAVAVVDDIIFKPTYDQVQIKAAFWAKFSTNPLVDVHNIGLTTVQKFVSDARIDRWWHVYGFKEWFLNEEEFSQRALALAHLAVEALEDILLNPDANPSARVNAAKLSMEIANKMPQKWQKVQYLDDQVQKMDQAQLEQFLRQKGLLGDGKKDSDDKDS